MTFDNLKLTDQSCRQPTENHEQFDIRGLNNLLILCENLIFREKAATEYPTETAQENQYIMTFKKGWLQIKSQAWWGIIIIQGCRHELAEPDNHINTYIRREQAVQKNETVQGQTHLPMVMKIYHVISFKTQNNFHCMKKILLSWSRNDAWCMYSTHWTLIESQIGHYVIPIKEQQKTFAETINVARFPGAYWNKL